MKTLAQLPAAVREEYLNATIAASIRNSKVGCVLGIVLMPAGALMDGFVYPEHFSLFLNLRLLSAALSAVVLVALNLKGLSTAQMRVLAMGWYLIPSFFVATMIAFTDGVMSSYYAGLNVIMLGASTVIQPTFKESAVAVSAILLMYVGACLTHTLRLGLPPAFWGSALNNAFFMGCTAVIVLTGSYIYNWLRLREFGLRHELNENRQVLERTNRQLEENNERLQELDRIKSRFFANISHELRTPLTLMLAPLENLMHRGDLPLTTEIRELLGTMHANGMRLLKLINDLLDLVRLESGRMELKREPVEMAAYLHGLASAVRPLAEERRLVLRVEVDSGLGTVSADPEKLEKILLNLLFNALKFTPSGGEVRLVGGREGEHLVLRVRDSGPGIAPEHLGMVFDRFWQADDSSRRRFKGTGIGLALVKELTEIQGGSVEAESVQGQGTSFTIRLPFLPVEAAAAPAEPASRTDGKEEPTAAADSEEWLAGLYRRAELFQVPPPARTVAAVPRSDRVDDRRIVLVADDEPDMLRFLVTNLQREYRVVEATDGRQAVERAQQTLPDLMLLDLMMPEMDGLQACAAVRSSPVLATIPVILLTARADEETKLAALGAGASDFLPKPFSTAELQVRVRNLIEAHQLQRRLAGQNRALESTITQLKETEIQLVQAEKLASLGRLSAGIIHEVNNPLNFATTALYALRNHLRRLPVETHTEILEILGDVDEGVGRVRNIVSELRTFTYPSPELVEDVVVTDSLAMALRLLSHEWRDRVRIDQHVPPDLVVLVNRNKFVQVLVNLLQNALDALSTKTFNGETPCIRVEGKREGTEALIVCRDNGPGIPAAVLGKIFDPFFTTKDVGKGMGLGLSICYRILEQFGGGITVRTEAGRFAEFTVRLPRPADVSTEAPVRAAANDS